MKIQDLLESKINKLIVVDVQPCAEPYLQFNIMELAQLINKSSRTLMLVNADDTSMLDDNLEYDIKPWWEEHGLEIDNNLTWIDKGYGYLRAWMDMGVPENIIIKVIREMYLQKVTDSRMLFNEDQEQLEQFVGDDWQTWMYDDALSVEWLSIGLLKEYNGCYICGGGQNECLKEVMLLMNAFNIKYKTMSKFVY